MSHVVTTATSALPSCFCGVYGKSILPKLIVSILMNMSTAIAVFSVPREWWYSSGYAAMQQYLDGSGIAVFPVTRDANITMRHARDAGRSDQPAGFGNSATSRIDIDSSSSW